MTADRPSGLTRMALAVAGAVAIMIGLAPVASAHVLVSSADATPGGYGMISFQVPTESETASTTGIVITFPDDTPIASVEVQPVPGWTARITSKKLAEPIQTDDGEVDSYVTSVDWRADSTATAIRPGQFQIFNLSAGPLPRRDTLVFPTLQRYSDGKDVAWNQIAVGNAEPDHPAPTLRLSGSASPPAPASDSAAQPTDPPPDNALSIIAVVIAAVAAVVAVIALLRTRRPSA